MTRVVVDASAFGALVFDEPQGPRVRQALHGAVVFAPELLKFELANVAWKKMRRHPRDARRILTALDVALDVTTGLVWQEVIATDVALLAYATGLTTYDATYLWLAGSLGADLLTLDAHLVKAYDAFTG